MKYYLIAGEASGDLHGANLIRELHRQDPEAQMRCWGGDLMAEAGADLVKHYRDLAFMGFTEVVMNLGTILSNLAACKKDIEQFNPDVVILIDYPGFNLRIAKFVHQLGIQVFYYISPQIWAWKESRITTIKKYVDRMFVILPFEEPFYAKHNYKVDFVGHPLLDAFTKYKPNAILQGTKPIIALLPGSRKQEIRIMLPVMLQAGEEFPEFKLIVAGAPSQPESFYRELLVNYPQVELVFGKTYDILSNSKAAMVTSGTATLEAALLGIPEVVCYKGGYISYRIARALIKIRFISLVNLIMDREIVRELIQHEFNTAQLVKEVKLLLSGAKRAELKTDYEALREKLGGAGASAKTATLMLKYLKSKLQK
jgi:lipid-A-disaccharide synthase